VVRIIVEKRLDLDLKKLIALACEIQPTRVVDQAHAATEIYDFILERMRAWYTAEIGLAPEVFEAVRVKRPASLSDFDARANAVAAFVELDAATSLAATNKRIANILRQAGGTHPGPVKPMLLTDDAEKNLYHAVQAARDSIAPLLERRQYKEALTALAELRETVDVYFDDVMVMTDDENTKRNRLATLAELRALFLDIADISRLSIG
jgi:glycyl-tRNA synthetase beta chain